MNTNTEFTRENGVTRDSVMARPQDTREVAMPRPEERKRLLEVASGGSSIGAIAGAGAGVLAILGLAGVLPVYMTAIATIALGAGLFAEGGALGAATSKLEEQTTSTSEDSIPTGAFAMQGIAGAGAIVLGILSLIGVLPGVLVPVAILVMGGALAFGGPARAELNLSALEVGRASHHARRIATEAVHSSGGLLMLVGLGAITLGILALVPVGNARTLELVALLGLGAATLLGDSVLLGRLGLAWRH
jgi:hypothetical protein